MNKTLTIIIVIIVVLVLVIGGWILIKKGYSSSSSSDSNQAQDKNTVLIKGLAFSPKNLEVAKGDSVTFKNEENITHTVTANDGTFDTGNIAFGQQKSVTFDTIGTFKYHCTIHPSMTGTITVK